MLFHGTARADCMALGVTAALGYLQVNGTGTGQDILTGRSATGYKSLTPPSSFCGTSNCPDTASFHAKGTCRRDDDHSDAYLSLRLPSACNLRVRIDPGGDTQASGATAVLVTHPPWPAKPGILEYIPIPGQDRPFQAYSESTARK